MTVILVAVAWLLTYLLHSTILLVGAAAIAAAGLVRSHAGRDTLWKVALVGGIVTATAQIALRLEPPAGHVAIAARPESPLVDVASIRTVAAAPVTENQTRRATSSRHSAEIAAAPTRTTRALVQGLDVSWPALLLQIWFVGALGFAAQLIWLRVSLKRELSSRRPVEDGPLADALAGLCVSAGVRVPRLSVSQSLAGPIAFGHEICLPERVFTNLGPAEQRAVLAHELGHVVRRDPLWLVAAALIETLLFLQPLNRLARKRLRAEAEFLCDDWAAERTGGVVLARCLAEVAGWVQGHPAPAAVAGMAGNCSQLVSRVERLLEGSVGARPVRWIVRAGAGVLVLALVAATVPGVAAEDLGHAPPPRARPKAEAENADKDDVATPVSFNSSYDGDGWGLVHEGHVIVLAAGYTVSISGHGHLGFRQWGRTIVVPDDYEIHVGSQTIDDDYELCDLNVPLRLVAQNGDGSWEIVPVRVDATNRTAQRAERAPERSWAETDSTPGRAEWAQVHADADAATDAALDGEGDAAIDTVVQLWLRDPDAVKRAARRIARTYDRDLRPQFESLGVQIGREMAPQLERLSTRVGRDLSPEFARLGAALGASIVAELAAPPEGDSGSGDYQLKGMPKKR